MARQFGYGVANTNGLRDFTGKTTAIVSAGRRSRLSSQLGFTQMYVRGFRSIIFILLGAL